MNILHLGRYKDRVRLITQLLNEGDKSVVELCFGDIILAKYCAESGRDWKGIDFNEEFVRYAKKSGFDAELKDVNELDRLPQADVCIMIASLYQFAGNFKRIIKLMLDSSKKVIIAEPTQNVSQLPGFIGKIAKKMTNAGQGDENFRFTEETFVNTMEDLSREFQFNYNIVARENRETVVVLEPNESKVKIHQK